LAPDLVRPTIATRTLDSHYNRGPALAAIIFIEPSLSFDTLAR